MSRGNPSDPDVNAWMFDAIYTFFQSPRWQTPVQSFIESNCENFEEGHLNDTPENRQIHKVFTKMIDKLMHKLLMEIGITQKQFLEACQEAKKNKNHWKIVKQILLVEDFKQFEKIMIKRNKELEKKALSIMLQKEEERLKRFFNKPAQQEEEDSEDESLAIAIKMSQEQAKKDQFMAQMNSTAGFQMALQMSKEGTFGQETKKTKTTPSIIQEEVEEEDEETAIMKAIRESEEEERRRNLKRQLNEEE